MDYANVVRSEYKRWLTAEAKHMIGDLGDSYSKVLDHMFETPYEPAMSRDSSRALDGIDLRLRMVERTNEWNYRDIYKTIYDDKCNILELLVSIDERCHYDLIGSENDDFNVMWTMLSSLGLADYPDSRYDREAVGRILERFCKNEYCKNGSGGLFTVKNQSIDMRRTEIWVQMGTYFAEKLFTNL